MEFIKKFFNKEKKPENKDADIVLTNETIKIYNHRFNADTIFLGCGGSGKVRRYIVPNEDFMYDEGVYYGINRITGDPIYYDKDKLMTGHELILGTHGSGKSYLCKKELKSIYKNTNDAIIVIQDCSEAVIKEMSKVEAREYISYSSLAELHNEKHIRVPEYCINPFQIYKSGVEFRDENIVENKSEFILEFISIVSGSELTAKQKSLIYNSIKKIYATYNDEVAPSLLTLIKELKNQESDELELIIKKLEDKLTEGLNNFNCSNKIDFDSRFTVYSMYGVKKEVYDETILILLESIWNTVVNNGAKGIRTHIVIDSIEYLLENESINMYLSAFIKRLRTNYGMITLIGTNVENILNNKYLVSITQNIETIRILNQQEEDLKLINEFFIIPEKFNSYFHNVEHGTGLLLNNRLKIPFQYVSIKKTINSKEEEYNDYLEILRGKSQSAIRIKKDEKSRDLKYLGMYTERSPEIHAVEVYEDNNKTVYRIDRKF